MTSVACTGRTDRLRSIDPSEPVRLVWYESDMRKMTAGLIVFTALTIAACGSDSAWGKYGDDLTAQSSSDACAGRLTPECAEATQARAELAERVMTDLGNQSSTPNIEAALSSGRGVASSWASFRKYHCDTVDEEIDVVGTCGRFGREVATSFDIFVGNVKKIA